MTAVGGRRLIGWSGAFLVSVAIWVVLVCLVVRGIK